jgi:hypothetical protein
LKPPQDYPKKNQLNYELGPESLDPGSDILAIDENSSLTVCAVKKGMQIFENGKKSTLVKIPFNPVSFKLMPNDPWKAIISGSK